jgi:curved DNA-binding protein
MEKDYHKDYYKIMGVPRSASQDDIKRAFRRLARKFHPDVSKEPNAEERFKQVNEAYEVLGDTEKRSAYDALGKNWRAGGANWQPGGRAAGAGGTRFGSGPGWERSFGFGRARPSGDGSSSRAGGTRDFGGAGAHEFTDLFESLFRGGGGASSERERRFDSRGEDVEMPLTITLEEAFGGTTKMLSLERASQSRGLSQRERARERRVRVHIPAGVTDGQRLKLTGQGNPGVGGGAAGDLIVALQFAAHPYFKAEGRDILLDLPVTPWEAALGATVQMPTLAGAVELRIPRSSEPGRKLRLKGRGLPGTPPGDQLVQLQIVTPPPLTPEAEALYRRMAETMPFDPRAYFGLRSAAADVAGSS